MEGGKKGGRKKVVLVVRECTVGRRWRRWRRSEGGGEGGTEWRRIAC